MNAAASIGTDELCGFDSNIFYKGHGTTICTDTFAQFTNAILGAKKKPEFCVGQKKDCIYESSQKIRATV